MMSFFFNLILTNFKQNLSFYFQNKDKKMIIQFKTVLLVLLFAVDLSASSIVSEAKDMMSSVLDEYGENFDMDEYKNSFDLYTFLKKGEHCSI
jgi:hypothetical protein